MPEEDPCQSKGKDKVPDPIPKELPSKNKGPQFEGQTSSEHTAKLVILVQLSQLQLTVGKLVDAEKFGVELEVQMLEHENKDCARLLIKTT